MIKLYSLSTCPWCKRTKQLLADKGLEYTLLDVDTLTGGEQEQALQEVDKLVSKRAFPILVVDDQVIQGYQEEKILEAIGHGK